MLARARPFATRASGLASRALLHTTRVHRAAAADEAAPSGPPLFFEPSPDRPGAYTVSFLPGTPRAADSPAVIGWSTAAQAVTPRSFTANPTFLRELHAALKDHAHEDPELVALAEHQKIGFMHVADARNPPPWGRIPDPDDIVGSVRLDDGKIVPGSFEPMPAHRLVSGAGIMQLSPALHAALLARLRAKSSS
ncbi:hypothetical protein H9P43_003461 [Blastocladiella emersonii ATCC 22665]|nr:hypothetical protein H9P43_003461 [Blastocladiella emersonii ATCC 22665]